MQGVTIMRHIEIDMGHRVTFHDGKCRNFHGHRYKIEAYFKGPVKKEVGSTKGMVADFGFIKKLLVDTIDEDCDHALTLWYQDPWVAAQFEQETVQEANDPGRLVTYDQLLNVFEQPAEMNLAPYVKVYIENVGQVYLIKTVPTAEELAVHWFRRVADRQADMALADPSVVEFTLTHIKVWETPNSFALYSAEDKR